MNDDEHDYETDYPECGHNPTHHDMDSMMKVKKDSFLVDEFALLPPIPEGWFEGDTKPLSGFAKIIKSKKKTD